MKKIYAIIFLFLALGAVWFFYPRERPLGDSEPDIPSIPSGKRLPASKQVNPVQNMAPDQTQPVQKKESGNESPAQVTLSPVHPLDSHGRKAMAFENLSLVEGVLAYHTKDASHGEWLYSEKGLHYYRADDVEASNVIFHSKENRYGRLTGEFVFTGRDVGVAETIATEFNLKKTVVDAGMGKMIVLIAEFSFFQNSSGLESLQSRYKDVLTPDVQYARQVVPQ